MFDNDMGICPVCKKRKVLRKYHSNDMVENFCSYECYIQFLKKEYKK
jgi:hypothetical protein